MKRSDPTPLALVVLAVAAALGIMAGGPSDDVPVQSTIDAPAFTE